jgi:hypothetical protein
VLLAGLVLLVGATLPPRHHASSRARFQVTPETLYALVAGPPDWRSGVKQFRGPAGQQRPAALVGRGQSRPKDHV